MKFNEAENKIYLNPGDLIITSKGQIIWTFLGSCVSIIFYSHVNKLSGICHAQLPYDKTNLSCKTTCPNPCGKKENEEFKYVTCSFKYMLDAFHNKGISSREITVGLYGGSNMFKLDIDKFRIGDLNVEKAKELITNNKLKIVNEDTGGNSSRTITYYSDTGNIELKYG